MIIYHAKSIVERMHVDFNDIPLILTAQKLSNSPGNLFL